MPTLLIDCNARASPWGKLTWEVKGSTVNQEAGRTRVLCRSMLCVGVTDLATRTWTRRREMVHMVHVRNVMSLWETKQSQESTRYGRLHISTSPDVHGKVPGRLRECLIRTEVVGPLQTGRQHAVRCIAPMLKRRITDRLRCGLSAFMCI